MPLSSEQFHTLYDGAAQPVVLVQDGAVAALNSCAQELFTVGTALCEYLPQDAELPETLYARPAVLPLLAAKMAPGGVVLCETEREADLPEQAGALTLVKQYNYGKIKVSRYERGEEV